MSDIVVDILKEELVNAKQRIKLYSKGNSRFAHSHLRKKQVGKSIYYYLQWRENGKPQSEYLGKLKSKEIKKYQAMIDQAKSDKEKIKKLKRRIKFIERSLKYEAIVK